MCSHATKRNELQTMACIVFLPSSKEIWKNPWVNMSLSRSKIYHSQGRLSKISYVMCDPDPKKTRYKIVKTCWNAPNTRIRSLQSTCWFIIIPLLMRDSFHFICYPLPRMVTPTYVTHSHIRRRRS